MNDPSYDDYLAAKTARHLDKQGAWESFMEQNEDRLLVRFLEHYEGVVEIPMVKSWTPVTTKLWEDFCEKAYEEACDAQPEYEPE